MQEFRAWIESRFPDVICQPSGLMRHPYISLGSHYGVGGQTFFWDAFFSAMRLSHSGFVEPIQGLLFCYLDHMDPRTGQVPRVLSPTAFVDRLDEQQIQPFLCQLAYLADRMSSVADRADFLLDRLTTYLGFWDARRRTSLGLYRWLDSYESGIDSNLAVACFAPLTVAGVDLNTYLVLEYRALASLAETWGKEDQSRAWRSRAEELAEAIRASMWNEERELFCNLDTCSGELIYRTLDHEDFCLVPWTNFTPLYARIATEEQAKATIRRYLLNRDEMRCRYGFRSFSRRSVYYTEARICPPANLSMRPGLKTASNWSGPVWTLANYILAHGLASYGFRDEALAVAGETAEVNWQSIRNDGAMFECYHPETGKGLWAEGYFSWNLLADCLADEIRGTLPRPVDLP
ncbi:MAG: trehalase family glycosidase [Planctomycetota bacterium]